jgi:hypothetical protein
LSSCVIKEKLFLCFLQNGVGTAVLLSRCCQRLKRSLTNLDRDQFIDLCQQVDVYGIPSFIAYENGKELGRFVSKDRKTQEEIEAFISGLK